MDIEASERELAVMVRNFYDKANADPVLGPLFAQIITDWEGHLALVTDFWSRHLLGTGRYQGNFFAAHTKMPMELDFFTRWESAFIAACHESLTPPLDGLAIAKAKHMNQMMKVGLFPWKDKDGTPLRHPPAHLRMTQD